MVQTWIGATTKHRFESGGGVLLDSFDETELGDYGAGEDLCKTACLENAECVVFEEDVSGACAPFLHAC